MTHPTSTPPPEDEDFQHLAPLLDDLLARLSRSTRDAILLRYYRSQSFAEVAVQIGTSDDAARKRVDRGLEKLRALAAQRGITFSAVAFAKHLEGVNPPPPATLVSSITASTATTTTASAASTAAIAKGATIMMFATKVKLIAAGAIAAVILIGGTTVVVSTLVKSAAPPVNAG